MLGNDGNEKKMQRFEGFINNTQAFRKVIVTKKLQESFHNPVSLLATSLRDFCLVARSEATSSHRLLRTAEHSKTTAQQDQLQTMRWYLRTLARYGQLQGSKAPRYLSKHRWMQVKGHTM